MAGQPRNRAARLAEAARLDELNRDWMLRPPPNLTDAPKPPPTEGDLTALWWREQVADLARAAKDRGEQVEAGASVVLETQARVYGALGVPPDVAAALMGMPEGTFMARFGTQYGTGSAAMIGQVAANLLRIATKGSDRYAVKAAIEIMNRRGGEPWRPPAQKIEVERKTTSANLIDSSKLLPEERQALRAIIMAATARGQMAAIESDGGA